MRRQWIFLRTLGCLLAALLVLGLCRSAAAQCAITDITQYAGTAWIKTNMPNEKCVKITEPAHSRSWTGPTDSNGQICVVTGHIVTKADLTCEVLAACPQPRLVETHCDTLSRNPTELLVSFTIEAPVEASICGVVLVPGVEASPPQTVGCGSPTYWACHPLPGSGGAEWAAVDAAYCIPAGASQSGFAIVTDQLLPSYALEAFFAPEEIYVTESFSPCPAAVPTRERTWGQVKASYR